MTQATAQRAITAAPFFCLVCATWIPDACTWDPETREFRGVEGPRGFATYREAAEASRFLAATPVKDVREESHADERTGLGSDSLGGG